MEEEQNMQIINQTSFVFFSSWVIASFLLNDDAMEIFSRKMIPQLKCSIMQNVVGWSWTIWKKKLV